MRMQTILVPLDGSEHSRQIIPAIIELFAPESARIILLRVADLPPVVTAAPPRPLSVAWPQPLYAYERDAELASHPLVDSQVLESWRADYEQSLLPAAHDLRAAGFQVKLEVQLGEPAAEILAYVEHHHISLIAMATRGRTGLNRLFLGSVAEAVTHQARVPVLLVKTAPAHATS